MDEDECLFYSHGECCISGRRCPYNGDEDACDSQNGRSDDPDWDGF